MATNDTGTDDVQMTDAITTGNDSIVTDQHSQCSRKLSIKTCRIGRFNHSLPTLSAFYANPACTVRTVPSDLQLPLFFAAYNDIARTEYVITKDLHIDLIRLMWFYGVARSHCFWNSLHVRYNVIIMAFLVSTGFGKAYCVPGCRAFVQHFLQAWLEGLMYQSGPVFTEREAFIRLGKDGPFDLHWSIRSSLVHSFQFLEDEEKSNLPGPADCDC